MILEDWVAGNLEIKHMENWKIARMESTDAAR